MKDGPVQSVTGFSILPLTAPSFAGRQPGPGCFQAFGAEREVKNSPCKQVLLLRITQSPNHPINHPLFLIRIVKDPDVGLLATEELLGALKGVASGDVWVAGAVEEDVAFALGAIGTFLDDVEHAGVA